MLCVEFDPTQPPRLNERVLKDKRKKLRETFDRVINMYVSMSDLCPIVSSFMTVIFTHGEHVWNTCRKTFKCLGILHLSGNVIKLTKSQRRVWGKVLSEKLFIANFTFLVTLLI